EDGIRVKLVTGVQTCALPISKPSEGSSRPVWALRLDGVPDCAIDDERRRAPNPTTRERGPGPEATGEEEREGTAVPGLGGPGGQIGRASCRERGEKLRGESVL